MRSVVVSLLLIPFAVGCVLDQILAAASDIEAEGETSELPRKNQWP